MLFTAPGDFSTSGVWHRLCPRCPPKKTHANVPGALSGVNTRPVHPGDEPSGQGHRTPVSLFRLVLDTAVARQELEILPALSSLAQSNALFWGDRPQHALPSVDHPYFGSTVCCAVHALCGPFKVPTSSKFLHWRSCRMPASDLLIDGVPGRATALYPVVNKGMGQRTAWNC